MIDPLGKTFGQTPIANSTALAAPLYIGRAPVDAVGAMHLLNVAFSPGSAGRATMAATVSNGPR